MPTALKTRIAMLVALAFLPLAAEAGNKSDPPQSAGNATRDAAQGTSNADENAAKLPPLPTSDRVLTAQVNLNGYALQSPGRWSGYALNRWATDDLIVDLSVHRKGDYQRHYRRMLEAIARTNPDAVVGTYLSGNDCRRRRLMQRYPPEAVACEPFDATDIRGTLNDETTRASLNYQRPETARRFADAIVEIAAERDQPLLFLDNIRHPSMLKGWIPWDDTIAFLRGIRDRLHRQGRYLFVNVALAPGQIPLDDARALTGAVDGLTLEMPLHPSVREDPDRLRKMVRTYRIWLDAGLRIVLIPVVPGQDKYEKQELQRVADVEARMAAALAVLVREPGDGIFVTRVFFKPAPDYRDWPERLGAPTSSLELTKAGTLRREFAHGTVALTPSIGAVTVRWKEAD